MARVYGSKLCGVCKNLKAFLLSLGVSFEDIDINENIEARDEILSQGFRQIPVMRIGDKYISGHNTDLVRQELGL